MAHIAPPAAPAALATLLERYDAAVIELPQGRARIRIAIGGEDDWDVLLLDGADPRAEPAGDRPPDALLRADPATWKRIARDLRGGMAAWSSRRLTIRHNLHLGVGFLAATSGNDAPGRLRFGRVRTERHGALSTVEAGEGPPLVLLHGLGGTKLSFLPTIAALAERHRMIAVDLPGFGDSDKPLGSYDAPFIARPIIALLDELELDRTHVLGHSLGGRIALEVALQAPERVDRLILMTPALAWLRQPPWAPYLRFARPELGFLQPAPRPLVEAVVRRLIPGARGDGWSAVAADEFLRSYLNGRGRHAFYATARNIALEPAEAFWARLRELSPQAMFVWGRHDPLVPIGFMRHVEEALPAARHVELQCGHIPQIEAPGPLHRAIGAFLAG